MNRVALVLSFALLCGCARNRGSRAGNAKNAPTAIRIMSPAFADDQPIPGRHTCDGEDLSPALMWMELPSETKGLALICEDPDAPGHPWVHWVLYGIPPTISELPESLEPRDMVLGSVRQGMNDFKRIGYGGPCPPPGKPHRYFFRLYAVDRPTDLAPRSTKQDVLRAIEGHVLAQGEVMGTYARASE